MPKTQNKLKIKCSNDSQRTRSPSDGVRCISREAVFGIDSLRSLFSTFVISVIFLVVGVFATVSGFFLFATVVFGLACGEASGTRRRKSPAVQPHGKVLENTI